MVCASMSPLFALQAVRMGKQFAQLVGHTNHRQKIQYVQKLTNENLSLKKVPYTTRFCLLIHTFLACVRACVCVCTPCMVYLSTSLSVCVHVQMVYLKTSLCVCVCTPCMVYLSTSLSVCVHVQMVYLKTSLSVCVGGHAS